MGVICRKQALNNPLLLLQMLCCIVLFVLMCPSSSRGYEGKKQGAAAGAAAMHFNIAHMEVGDGSLIFSESRYELMPSFTKFNTLVDNDIKLNDFEAIMKGFAIINASYPSSSSLKSNFLIGGHGYKWKIVKRVSRGGEFVTSSSSVSNMTFHSLQKALRSGFTVVCNKIQLNFEKANLMAREFKRLLPAVGYNININLYLTPPGSFQGFESHYDWMDSFVLQIFGCKSWRLYSPVLYPFATRKGHKSVSKHDLALLSRNELEMKPGSLLYIPRGLVHEAATNCSIDSGSFSDPSLHLTVGIEVDGYCSLKDFFLKFVNTTLSSLYMPSPSSHNGDYDMPLVVFMFFAYVIDAHDFDSIIWRSSMYSFYQLFDSNQLKHEGCLELIHDFGKFSLSRKHENERDNKSEYLKDCMNTEDYFLSSRQYWIIVDKLFVCLMHPLEKALEKSFLKALLTPHNANATEEEKEEEKNLSSIMKQFLDLYIVNNSVIPSTTASATNTNTANSSIEELTAITPFVLMQAVDKVMAPLWAQRPETDASSMLIINSWIDILLHA